MSQITWRNVNSDMTAYQGRALEGANRSFDSMFDKLSGAVARTQAIDDKNWDNTKVNRTNDALNQIMGYANPEAMAEAQKAGALQALLQGGQIDQQAVRSAFDARMPELQKRVVQGINHKNVVVDDTNQPLEDMFRAAAIKGDNETMARIQAEYKGRNAAGLAEFGDGRNRLGVTRKREDDQHVWAGQDQAMQGEAHRDGLLSNAVGRERDRAAMADGAFNRKMAQDKFALDKARYEKGEGGSAAQIERQYEVAKANSAMSMGAYGTKEGMANLNKELTARGISPSQRDDILYNLSKYYKGGVALSHDEKGKAADRLPLPIATVLEEVDRASDFGFFGVSRKGDATVNALDKRFGVNSNGSKNSSTFADRDGELVNEIYKFNKWDADRTAGLYREDQNKEIRNASKGKGKKQK